MQGKATHQRGLDAPDVNVGVQQDTAVVEVVGVGLPGVLGSAVDLHPRLEPLCV